MSITKADWRGVHATVRPRLETGVYAVCFCWGLQQVGSSHDNRPCPGFPVVLARRVGETVYVLEYRPGHPLPDLVQTDFETMAVKLMARRSAYFDGDKIERPSETQEA